MTRAARYDQLEAALLIADRLITTCQRNIATAQELRASIVAQATALRQQMGESEWEELTALRAAREATAVP